MFFTLGTLSSSLEQMALKNMIALATTMLTAVTLLIK